MPTLLSRSRRIASVPSRRSSVPAELLIPRLEEKQETSNVCAGCGTNVSSLLTAEKAPGLGDDYAAESDTFDAFGAGVCPVCYEPLGDGSALDAFIAR